MRGSPFLQAIFMVAVFLLASIPVYRLTRPAPAAAAADSSAVESPADAISAKPALLEVDAMFAPAPADFQIKNLGRTVLAGSGPQSHFHTRWTAAVPPEGVDLVIEARWSSSAAGAAPASAASGERAAAARVTVQFPDGRQVEKSFWSAANSSLAEVFTVPGAPGDTAAP